MTIDEFFKPKVLAKPHAMVTINKTDYIDKMIFFNKTNSYKGLSMGHTKNMTIKFNIITK
mgnify:CR=1 FL=1